MVGKASSSGIGAGYDLSCQTYSPDGTVFQIEYAAKAAENSGTSIGIRVKDGIVFGVEKLVHSKLLEPGSNRRIQSIDKHIGMCSSGLLADARQLVNRARSEAKQYKQFYHESIPARILADRVASFVQSYTLVGYMRPFCCSVLLGTWDSSEGPQLHVIEPSGTSFGYFGATVGKATQAAKGEIEKLKLQEMTIDQAVKEVARIIYTVHDDVKDKDFELEMSWICKESNYEHQLLPKNVLDEAVKHAKSSLEEEMQQD